jgi:asparagine synthase (glutamine-hydrolysing)
MRNALAYYELRTSQSPNRDPLSEILFMDLTSYLPDDLLIKVDIASMANSLEVRSPFLDHKFVEFVQSIPNSLRLRNGEAKYILKRAFARLLPDEILNRTKMGFSIPIDRWFRHDLRKFSHDVLLGGNNELKEYFDKTFLQYMLDAHCSGRVNYGTKLWLLINFAIWHHMFISKYKYLNA